MGIHEVVDAILVGARDVLNDEWRLAEPGPTKVVTLAPQDVDVALRIIEIAWEALRKGDVVGASCDAMDEAFKALALAAAGPVAECVQDERPKLPRLEVLR